MGGKQPLKRMNKTWEDTISNGTRIKCPVGAVEDQSCIKNVIKCHHLNLTLGVVMTSPSDG
jgi:hypothetical protein